MIFYSNSKKNDLCEVFVSKELRTHIAEVKENALFHFADNVDLGLSKEELKELVKLTAYLHDLGKYTTYFQNYLLKKESIDNRLKQHARIGGFTAFNLLEERKSTRLNSSHVAISYAG